MTAVRLNDEYLTLIKQFPLVPIESRGQLHKAIAVMKELTTPQRFYSLTRAENSYLDVLIDVIAKYENAHKKPFAKPMTPKDTLGYLLEQSGINQSELARQTGARQSHISEFLAGNRGLSKENIVKIARFFKVSPELFL